MGQGRPLPGTRVAALVDLIESDDDEMEGPANAGPRGH